MQRVDLTQDFLIFLSAEGYSNIRDIPGHGICGVLRYGVSTGLCCGLTWSSVSYRYCYQHSFDAILAIGLWDGEGHPSGPWIKRKGLGEDLHSLDYAHAEALVWKELNRIP